MNAVVTYAFSNASSPWLVSCLLLVSPTEILQTGLPSQALPPLGDAVPEARLNLVTYHLRKGDISEAFNLVKDLTPSTPQEYILKVHVQ